MTRVLFVTGEFPPDEGGVADYTRCLARALAAAGHSVDVLTSRRGRAESASATAEGSRVTVHRVLRNWGWGTLGATRRVVDTLRPEVVHLQYQTAAFGMHPAVNILGAWLRRTTSAKTAVTYHDLKVPYLFPKAGALRNWVTLRPAHGSRLTIATNVEDWLRLQAAGATHRLALVPIGSNVPDAPPAGYVPAAWRAEHGIAPGCGLVAYFGFLNASKGGRVLVDMLARLRADGSDVRLVMIGGRTGASDPTNAGYLIEFERDLAAAGLANAVLWTGHVPPPQVSAWLHAADVAALPYADGASYRRGSLLACLAHGMPVVTSTPAQLPTADLSDLATADVPPALVDGANAVLVPPGDAATLAHAVQHVLGDPAHAELLGAGAAALASWFEWDRIATRHAALYKAL